jgi:hypothetical protein
MSPICESVWALLPCLGWLAEWSSLTMHGPAPLRSYSDHQKRNPGYNPTDFNNEWTSIREEITSSASLRQSTDFLVGPSICCEVEGFLLDDVLNAGFLTDNLDSLAVVAVQQ